MISAAERQERLEAVEDTIGTHRAEGLTFDGPTLKLMEQYIEGELTLDQLTSAMRSYAASLGAKQASLVSAA